MRRLAGMAAAAALSFAACGGEPRTTRCETLCAREAECAAEQAPDRADPARRHECERACGIFERDPEMRDEVGARAECIEAAGDCEAVLACGDP